MITHKSSMTTMDNVNSWLNMFVRILDLGTPAILNHKLPSCLHQPLIDFHFGNSPLHCLLLEEVVVTCQDSQFCQGGLHHLYKYEVGGFLFLL